MARDVAFGSSRPFHVDPNPLFCDVIKTDKETILPLPLTRSTATATQLEICYLSYPDTSYAPFSSESPRPLSLSPSYLF